MKFRTDFVTNSSDSSFIVYRVKNDMLFNFLKKLGITVKSPEEGVFCDGMEVVLPSGESSQITNLEWDIPVPSDYSSISAWIMRTMLTDCNEDTIDDEEEMSDFSRELLEILEKADVMKINWETIEEMAEEYDGTDFLEKYLGEAFDGFESGITEMEYEYDYGFEGDVGPCEYVKLEDGVIMGIDYSMYDSPQSSSLKGKEFAIDDDLELYKREDLIRVIQEGGGTVVEEPGARTEYIICSDINSKSDKMDKAKHLGVSLLPERAFVFMFDDPKKFEETMSVGVDSPDFEDMAWEVTYSGGLPEFYVENGLGPITIEVLE